MIDKEAILKKAEKYDVVTFDVFDTLIIRDVFKPADIFRLSYGEIGRYLRVIAEIISRALSKNGEVTLKDIDRYFCFSTDKEIEVEKRFCRANPDLKDVVSKLIDCGKKVYAISDMYLDNDTVSGLLEKAGYSIPVMVSCDYGCTKKDGTLFSEFIKKYDLDPAKVLHIGDNFESDFCGAQKVGIDAVHIEKDNFCLSYLEYDLKNIEYAAFVNHGLNRISDPIERIGYEIVGPIILSFCQWVHDRKIDFGFERLFFLSRDMRIIYEVYSKLYSEDDAEYLRISRKSLEFADDNQGEFIDYLKNSGCFGNCAVVDTGWVGIAQVKIDKFCKLIDASSDLGGLYMGVKNSFFSIERSDRSEACFYKTRFDRFKCSIITSFLEALIGVDEGRVIEYRNGNPVFDSERESSRNGIACGAEKFVNDLIINKNNKKLDIRDAKRTFERLFYFPKRKDINTLEKLKYEDVVCSDIVSYDKKNSYFIHPGKFINDLKDSAWKGAFFKKTGLLYPILFFAYGLYGPFGIAKSDKAKIDKLDH